MGMSVEMDDAVRHVGGVFQQRPVQRVRCDILQLDTLLDIRLARRVRNDGGHAVRKRQEQVVRYGADADGREVVRVGVSDVEAVVVSQYQVDARVRYSQVVE